MQDIRKPYTRSRSSNDLQSRVEQFESARYRRDDYEEEPVQIPTRRRRDVSVMDMYPRKSREGDLYDEEDYPEEEYLPPSPRRVDPRARHKRRRSAVGTFAFIVGMVLLVTGVSLYTYVFNSATITVVPKYKDVGSIGKVFVFAKEGTDATGIAYNVVTSSLSKSKTLTLSESKKVEAKASGKITVYNNYDASPQKLIKNTRFESAKGKIYRINQSIEVPGKKGDTPGSIDVTVYADGNGADYNIESTTFTIPGFKGTSREGAFYAKTKTTLTGGSSGSVSSASLSDLNAAKDSLALELTKSVQGESLKLNKEGYIPLHSATEVTFEDNEQEVLSGSTSAYKVTATAHVMMANEIELAEAIAKTFGDYDNQPVRLTYTDTLTYTRKQSDRIPESKSLSLLVEGTPRIVWQINTSNIKDMVKGRDRDDFKPLMKTINSIESAEISFSPMWLSRFPDDNEKLVVTEMLPKR